MKDTVLLEVKQEDIDFGVRGYAAACPITLAARRHFPYAQYLTTDKNGIQIDSSCILMPNDAACAFMDRFDDGEKVEPCVFELEVL